MKIFPTAMATMPQSTSPLKRRLGLVRQELRVLLQHFWRDKSLLAMECFIADGASVLHRVPPCLTEMVNLIESADGSCTQILRRVWTDCNVGTESLFFLFLLALSILPVNRHFLNSQVHTTTRPCWGSSHFVGSFLYLYQCLLLDMSREPLWDTR